MDEQRDVWVRTSARIDSWEEMDVKFPESDGMNESCLVMQDVEGNEFCLD